MIVISDQPDAPRSSTRGRKMEMPTECDSCDNEGTDFCSPMYCPNERQGYTEEQIRTALDRAGITASHLVTGFWEELKELRG